MINNIAHRAEIARGNVHGSSYVTARLACMTDIPLCKLIADQHRDIFGFLTRSVFTEAAERQRLLVAETKAGQVVGFVRFNHRIRGIETAIYDIAVERQTQGKGIGRMLIVALATECRRFNRETIALRCPEDTSANGFYAHIGFQQGAIETGKRRRLVVWRLPVETVL